MKKIIITFAVGSLVAVPVFAHTGYEKRVILGGLERPVGIVAQGSETLYFTQLPTPTVPGSMGGRNTVNRFDLETGTVAVLTMGEPEPTNLALDKHGNLYWTCKSAGVILERSPAGNVSLFLGGLPQPSGIAVDRWDNIYFTLVPTPAVSGMMGGSNSVHVTDGQTVMSLSQGEPEPSDIAVSRNGTAYWTCKSAGVILRRGPGGPVSLLLNNLSSPTGIAIDHQGQRLFWSEVPTPGLSARNGGSNQVAELNLATMEISVVDFGDPEPTDVTVARNGNLYWTCTSAGVIVEAKRKGRR